MDVRLFLDQILKNVAFKEAGTTCNTELSNKNTKMLSLLSEGDTQILFESLDANKDKKLSLEEL